MDGYGTNENLHIAFAVGDFFSTELSPHIYDDYGSIKMYYEYWDDEKDELVPIQTRPCTADDF